MSEVATASASSASNKSKASTIALIVGAVFLAITLFGVFSGASHQNARPAYGLLIMFCFYLSIGIGSLLLVLIHHVFGAGWSVIPRRQLEHVITIFPWLGLIFLPLLYVTFFVDHGLIWRWFDILSEGSPIADDVLYTKKAWWLGTTFFVVRYVIYFAGWTFLATKLRKYSFSQDRDGDAKWTRKMVVLTAIGIPFTAITLSGAAIDWIKGTEYHWFSTMFGVWFFAASMRVALAVLALICLKQVFKNGPLTGIFKKGHLYDIGCVMLAFTVFWAYISFSQYFLIYNANIPEETFWYNMRELGGWWNVSMFLIFGYFLFPFIFLLFFSNKVKAFPMILISVWVILGHLADLYFNILPSMPAGGHGHGPTHASIALWDVTAFIGIGGICIWSFINSWKKEKIIPIHDPRIEESLHHHGR